MLKSELEKKIDDSIKALGDYEADRKSGKISEEELIKRSNLDDSLQSLKKQLKGLDDEPNTINNFINKNEGLLREKSFTSVTKGDITAASKPVEYNDITSIYKKATGNDKPFDEDLAEFIDPSSANSWYNMSTRDFADLAKDLGISVSELARELQVASTNEDRRQKAYFNTNSKSTLHNIGGYVGNLAEDIGHPNYLKDVATGEDYSPVDMAGDLMVVGSNFIPELKFGVGATKIGANLLAKYGPRVAKQIGNIGIQEGTDYAGRKIGGTSDVGQARTGVVTQTGLRALGPKFITKGIADLPMGIPIVRDSPLGKNIAKNIEDIADTDLKTSSEVLEDFENTLTKDEAEWLKLYHKDPLKHEDINKLDKLQTKAFKLIDKQAQLIKLKAIRQGASEEKASKEALDFANKTIEDLKLKGKYDNVPKHSYQLSAEKIKEELDPIYSNENIDIGTKNIKLKDSGKRLNEETGINPYLGSHKEVVDTGIKAARNIGSFGRRNVERANIQEVLPEAIKSKNNRELQKEREVEISKLDRWNKGYATFDEQKTPEYIEFMNKKMKSLRGK